VVVPSPERQRDFVFSTYFANSSGNEGIALKLPTKVLEGGSTWYYADAGKIFGGERII
jgi:hypothetical protein